MTFLLDTFPERSRHGLSRKLTLAGDGQANSLSEGASRRELRHPQIDPQVDDEVSRERALDLSHDYDRGFCDVEEDGYGF